MTMRYKITAAFACALPTFVTALLGALASAEAAEFYAQLRQPAWAPPGWVFGPVWTLLYIAMAVAAWRVWVSAGWPAARPVLLLFYLQLALNAGWSWLFFYFHLGGVALLELVLLWLLVLLTAIGFWRHSRMAALLLVPYLCWVGFAGLLNFSVWQLNPGILG